MHMANAPTPSTESSGSAERSPAAAELPGSPSLAKTTTALQHALGQQQFCSNFPGTLEMSAFEG
jgi:hypothetical protein